jgi:plasmid stabilization system protein ParE
LIESAQFENQPKEKYHLFVTSQAMRDLEEIRLFRQSIGAYSENTDKLIKLILSDIERLKRNPLIGLKLSNKTDISTRLRYIIAGDYLTFFEIIDERNIHVKRILNGRTNYIQILFRGKKSL